MSASGDCEMPLMARIEIPSHLGEAKIYRALKWHWQFEIIPKSDRSKFHKIWGSISST